MKRQIKSAIGPYDNNINVDRSKLEDLGGYLRLAYNTIEEMDDETFQALGDGEQMSDDLDVYLREVDATIKFLGSL